MAKSHADGIQHIGVFFAGKHGEQLFNGLVEARVGLLLKATELTKDVCTELPLFRNGACTQRHRRIKNLTCRTKMQNTNGIPSTVFVRFRECALHQLINRARVVSQCFVPIVLTHRSFTIFQTR